MTDSEALILAILFGVMFSTINYFRRKSLKYYESERFRLREEKVKLIKDILRRES